MRVIELLNRYFNKGLVKKKFKNLRFNTRRNYSTCVETGPEYKTIMEKLQLAQLQKDDINLSKNDILGIREKIDIEAEHIQSIALESKKDGVISIIVFIHTSKEHDVKLPSGEKMKMKKTGTNSYTGYEGVNEMPYYFQIKEKDFELCYKNISEEKIKSMKLDKNDKLEQQSKLMEDFNNKEEKMVYLREGKKVKFEGNKLNEENLKLEDEFNLNKDVEETFKKTFKD